jgi:hypothetical protein
LLFFRIGQPNEESRPNRLPRVTIASEVPP